MADKRIHTFENGATLIYYQHNVSNTTNATIGFKCGADCDGAQKGISHFLEHMLFSGTKTMTEKEIYDFIKYSGTEQNACTTQDYIVVEFDCPNSVAPKIFKLNSDMLLKKDFDDKECDRERQVVLEELMLAKDRGPIGGQLGYLINKRNTLLSEDILGNEETLNNIHAKELKAYSNKYFVSENLVMSVVSSLPFEDIKALCEKYFVNKVKSKPKNKVNTATRLYNYGKTSVALRGDIPNANSFNIQFTFKGKQDVEQNDIFTKFENFLFNGFNGKFYERMRIIEPLVYSAHFHNIELPDLKLKCFNISTSPKNVHKAIQATVEILNDIIYKGVSNKDIALFKTTMMAERERKSNIKYYESFDLFDGYIHGEDIFVHDFYKKVLTLTKKQVNDYFKETYGKSKLLLSMIGDLYKAANIPTEEDIKAIEEKYKYEPYTVPDEVIIQKTLDDFDEMVKNIKLLPTITDILNQYHMQYKIIYDYQKANPHYTLQNKKLLKAILGDDKVYAKLGKVNLKKQIEKLLKEAKQEDIDENTK